MNCEQCPVMMLKGRKQYDYIVVGAGLFGSVVTHRAIQDGKRVLVIEKRNSVGGNLRCQDIDGINVHKYGPHIFHTSNKRVWDYVTSLTKFNSYINAPLANYHGKLYHLPFNMNTFAAIWGITTPDEAKAIIETQTRNAIEEMLANCHEKPTNLAEMAKTLVGEDLFNIFIKEYSEKQWGRPCEELPAFLISRLPIRYVYNNNYFDDIYQGVPEDGYNSMINTMLKGADIITGCNFNDGELEKYKLMTDKIIYTGAIDEFYKYKYGHLEYRSLRFENKILETNNYMGCAVMNFTDNSVPYTRIIEHRHFYQKNVQNEETVLTYEYPVEWKNGMEAFYPINDKKNNDMYLKYAALASREKDIIFGGRLAEYKYYDMDEIIENALKLRL